tara:strand:- start:202 stop:453 length:252 start_codon:yes stop_codon:yes gene_type:complete
MIKEHCTVGELIEILTQPRDTTMNTDVIFYFLQGYNLESMEIESVLHFDESQIEGSRVEITLKRIGTDEGGNMPDDDVGVSVL